MPYLILLFVNNKCPCEISETYFHILSIVTPAQAVVVISALHMYICISIPGWEQLQRKLYAADQMYNNSDLNIRIENSGLCMKTIAFISAFSPQIKELTQTSKYVYTSPSHKPTAFILPIFTPLWKSWTWT